MYAMLRRYGTRQFCFCFSSRDGEVDVDVVVVVGKGVWDTDLFPGQPLRPNENGCAAAFLSLSALGESLSHRSGMNSSGFEKFEGEREVAHEGTETVVCELFSFESVSCKGKICIPSLEHIARISSRHLLG
jgi:hypothetical protein